MAEENQKLDSKRIFALGMVLVLLPAMLFITVQNGAFGAPDLQTNRFGTFTLTTTAGANFYGPFSIPFSPPFSSTPGDIKLVTLGSSGGFNVGLSTISFLSLDGSGVAGTWTAMPAATTELFGTTCCRSFSNMNGFSQGCFLVVDIITVSNMVGATLSVQWATATAGPWTTFTGSSVDVHSIALNPRTSSIFGTTTGQASSVYLRIVGAGGGGVGDNPQFSHVQMTCAGTFSGITPSWLNATPTGFFLFVTLTTLDPVGGNSIVIQWSAYLCTSGQGNNNC